jgi:hypothetical protein
VPKEPSAPMARRFAGHGNRDPYECSRLGEVPRDAPAATTLAGFTGRNGAWTAIRAMEPRAAEGCWTRADRAFACLIGGHENEFFRDDDKPQRNPSLSGGKERPPRSGQRHGERGW